jgi:hypothetical protein
MRWLAASACPSMGTSVIGTIIDADVYGLGPGQRVLHTGHCPQALDNVPSSRLLVPYGGLLRGRPAPGETLLVNGARVVAAGRNRTALARLSTYDRVATVELTGNAAADTAALRAAGDKGSTRPLPRRRCRDRRQHAGRSRGTAVSRAARADGQLASSAADRLHVADDQQQADHRQLHVPTLGSGPATRRGRGRGPQTGARRGRRREGRRAMLAVRPASRPLACHFRMPAGRRRPR